MSAHDPPDPADRHLWSAFARSRPAGSCPEPGELAGYLDGRLEEAAREAIEDHLADCPECLEAVADVRTWTAEEASAGVLVDPEILAAARSLVPDEHARTGVDRRRRRWWSVTRWGAAAAASLVVCLLGYRLGARSVADGANGGELLREVSFGALDGADAEVDLLALAVIEEAAP